MKNIITLSSIAFAIASSAAQSEVRINGFANFVGGITSSDTPIYGYDSDVNFANESVFAVQITGDVNDKVTATGQLVARGEDNYSASFEWAYLTYSASDNLSVSAGRFRLPLFIYSSSLDIGYSYNWVSAPQSVYDVPFQNLDGLRFDYSNYVDEFEYSIQLAVGTYENENEIYTNKGDNTVVISGEGIYGILKMRAVYGRANSTLNVYDLESTFNQLQQVLPTALYDNLEHNDDTGEFMGLGLEANAGSWFLASEVTSVEIEDSYSRKDLSYYVTAGLRFGKLTTSLTYEATESDDDFKFVDSISQMPAELQPSLFGIQTVFDGDSEAQTLGIRYDYDTNIALKLDGTHYTDNLNSDNDANLVRFAVNYIF
jgi:hypothetical protein